MHTVSMTRTPSSRATIAAGTRPPRVIAITAWNGPTSLSRQVSARQSRWNWSHDTGNALPARSWALSVVSPFISSLLPNAANAAVSNGFLLARDVKPREHFLHRIHGSHELVRIARAHHEIGVRLLLLVGEGIAADDGIGMGFRDRPQRTADVAFPGIGAHRIRQHLHARFQLGRDDVHHRLHDRGHAGPH